jgi:signal transduction histidine kinase
MSSLANVVELPVRRDEDARLDHDLVLMLATADDLASAMNDVVERVRRESRAARVEWWARDDEGVPELVAETGVFRARRENVDLEPVGTFVFHGGRLDATTEAALLALTPIIRRRAAEERLARTAVDLARRNQALEDFAALVAHELKTPLLAALLADAPAGPIEDALDLVDTLLEAARTESGEPVFTAAEAPLEAALQDLGADLEVTTDPGAPLPLPHGPLRVIMRNLLSNAVSAGATHVRVGTMRSRGSWQLLVDDDGVGVAQVEDYASGSGLGLSLCRRIAGRYGGAIELAPRPSGGTRATVAFSGRLR